MGAKAFEIWHPATVTVLFGGIVVLSMLAMEPVCTALVVCGGLLFSCLTTGVASSLAKLKWQLPLLALICLINPLFAKLGSTLVFKVGPFLVYAESLAFGAMMGALLVGVLLWIEAMASVLGQDDLLTMTGGFLPTVALAASMTARLVPQLLVRGRSLRASFMATTAAPKGFMASARIMGALFTSALEDSLERADSMRARGWGAWERPGTQRDEADANATAHRPRRRTQYALRKFRERDAVAFVVCVTLVAAAWLGVRTALAGWRFYPRMGGLAPLWAYVCLGSLVLLPSVVVLVEVLRDKFAYGEVTSHE